MKTQDTPTWLALFLTIFTTFIIHSNAKKTQPFSNILRFNRIAQWIHHQTQSDDTKMKLSPTMLLAAFFCFIASSLSSAGGIGGGGLYIPILTIVAGLELKTASSFSAFMVTGGSIANVLCHLFIKSSKFGGKTLVDFDIALLSEPCMLLGISIGVICNIVFPEWLITILFAVFLAWSTFKTCKNGVVLWRLESEEVMNRNDEIVNLENGRDEHVCDKESEEVKRINAPLLGSIDEIVKNELRFPWMKLGMLVVIWFSFSILSLLRGNRYGQGITSLEPCGVAYWGLSSLQIPIAMIFTACILLRKKNHQQQTADQQDIEDPTRATVRNKLIFPIMALIAGILGGVFGIGGGMLISPLLLHVGIAPEVTAATCSFMVFFSSIMSAFQYLLLGMEHTDTALIFSVLCFFASLLGLLVVQSAILKSGRASLIVFSVSTVMALSTVLMTSFGAIDVWTNYESGNDMGFKPPC